MSTLPFGIDVPASSPSKGRDLNEVVVEIFNKGKSVSLRREVTPKSVPIVATNYKLKSEERLANNVTHSHLIIIMYLCTINVMLSRKFIFMYIPPTYASYTSLSLPLAVRHMQCIL